MIDRRGFVLAVTGGLLARPRPVAAQRTVRTPRIGLLAWEGCLSADSPFGQALGDLGHRWGQTVQMLCRSGEGDYGRLANAAGALASQNVDAIAALTHITAFAAHRATRSIPIVMIASGDPVRTGLVASLARPGGNVTGLTYYAADLVEKRLHLLKEIIPRATRVAVLENPESDHVFGMYRQDTERAARAVGLQLVKADVSRPQDLERGFDRMVADGAQGLLVLTDPMLSANARRIAELAARHRLPAMYWAPWFVEAGGLIAYSPDYAAMLRRAASYVDRILKGARPADLPIEQPTKFDLVVNLKTAKALGLTIPESLMLRAGQVIE
jgi:putative ABC transport system substrate-binding protein